MRAKRRVSNAASDLQFAAGQPECWDVSSEAAANEGSPAKEVGGELQGCAGGGRATRLVRLECNAGREQGHAAGEALD